MSSANTNNRYRKVAFAFQQGEEEKAGQIMIESHVGVGEEHVPITADLVENPESCIQKREHPDFLRRGGHL